MYCGGFWFQDFLSPSSLSCISYREEKRKGRVNLRYFLEPLSGNTLHRFRKTGKTRLPNFSCEERRIVSALNACINWFSSVCIILLLGKLLQVKATFLTQIMKFYCFFFNRRSYFCNFCSPDVSFQLIKAMGIFNGCILLTLDQLYCPKPILISPPLFPIGSERIDNEQGVQPRAPIVD